MISDNLHVALSELQDFLEDFRNSLAAIELGAYLQSGFPAQISKQLYLEMIEYVDIVKEDYDLETSKELKELIANLQSK